MAGNILAKLYFEIGYIPASHFDNRQSLPAIVLQQNYLYSKL